MSEKYPLWGWSEKELHAGTLVKLSEQMVEDPLFGQVGLIIGNATPRSLSKFSSRAIETWLQRGPAEDLPRSTKDKNFEYYVEPAYIIKFGEKQTIYSYSEITIISDSHQGQDIQ